jgi:hypothetical protein
MEPVNKRQQVLSEVNDSTQKEEKRAKIIEHLKLELTRLTDAIENENKIELVKHLTVELKRLAKAIEDVNKRIDEEEKEPSQEPNQEPTQEPSQEASQALE